MRHQSSACDWCGAPLTNQQAGSETPADERLCSQCYADYLADTATREIRHNEELPD